jgi:branched-chain amino acid transport system permease protein
MTTRRFSFFQPQRLLVYGLGAVILLALPEFMPNDYVFRVVIAIIIDVPLALAQNLITGFTGMLTLGQAAFYGIGAYTSALLVMRLGAPWPVALLAAGVVACVFGILLGFPCLRVGSDYLTLMTIGFGEIFHIVTLNWMNLTRGPMGLPGVPPPRIGSMVFNTSQRQYYLYLGIAVLCFLFMHRLTKSHVGRALIAIREDETAASAMGINVAYYKLLAFACGTLWAGFSGSMLAHFLMFVGPMTFSLNESIFHMQMAILGGLGSLPGSVLGAAILVSLPQIFQPLYEYRMLLNGMLMVLLMTLRPEGIMGTSAAAKSARGTFLKQLGLFGRKKTEDVESSSKSQPSVRQSSNEELSDGPVEG